MNRDKKEALLLLKLIAAEAEKLALDLENNKLWEGDFKSRSSVIVAHSYDLNKLDC